MRMRWVTSEIIELLKDLDCSSKVGPPGGDVDTEGVTLIANEAEEIEPDYKPRLSICGFTTQRDIESPADTEIEMIEVTDGNDSSGGLNVDDEATCILYGRVLSKLRKAGFLVVPSMDDYF